MSSGGADDKDVDRGLPSGSAADLAQTAGEIPRRLLSLEVRADGSIRAAAFMLHRCGRPSPDHAEGRGVATGVPQNAREEVRRPVAHVVGGDALGGTCAPGGPVALAHRPMVPKVEARDDARAPA